MIVDSDFIWLHFPKCAGTATERALRRLTPDAKFDSGDRKQHDGVRERQTVDPSFHVGSRKIICGFRRLPHWMLSRVHFEAARGARYVATRQMLVAGQFFRETGEVRDADYNARRYSVPHVDAWVRVECIAEDLAKALEIDVQQVQSALQRQNQTPKYLKNLEFWFTPDELRSLYHSNPAWSAIERQVYGSLLID